MPRSPRRYHVVGVLPDRTFDLLAHEPTHAMAVRLAAARADAYATVEIFDPQAQPGEPDHWRIDAAGGVTVLGQRADHRLVPAIASSPPGQGGRRDDGHDHDLVHSRDEDCTLGPDDVCVYCAVYHGDPCPLCGGRGFHVDGCDGGAAV